MIRLKKRLQPSHQIKANSFLEKMTRLKVNQNLQKVIMRKLKVIKRRIFQKTKYHPVNIINKIAVKRMKKFQIRENGRVVWKRTLKIRF